jgi:hypothetical protein
MQPDTLAILESLCGDDVAWSSSDRAYVKGELRPLLARLASAEMVVEAARLFRKADTGGGFNDRVECGRALDAALSALDGGKGGV